MAANDDKDGTAGDDGKVSLFRKPSTYVAVVAIAVVWQLAECMFTSGAPDCDAERVLDIVQYEVKSYLEMTMYEAVADTAKLTDIREVEYLEAMDIYVCKANVEFGDKGTAEATYRVRLRQTDGAFEKAGSLIVTVDTHIPF